MRTALAALVLATAIATTAHAAPADAKQRAAQSFAAGKTAFAHGDFAAAGAAFEQAALYVPHPAALLDAAEAWALAGDRVRAAQLCDRVLAMAPLEARFRAAADEQLARLAPHVATVRVRTAPGARITVDGRDEAGGPIRLAPGGHVLEAAGPEPGRRRSEAIELAAGEMREIDLVALAPEPARPPRTQQASPPLATWVAFGAAAAASGVAVVYGIRTIDAKDAFDASPTFETRDDFVRERAITNVAIGVAAVSVIAGGVLWLFAPRRER